MDERKQYPVATGVLDYFPRAIREVSHVSFIGNEQHNPGTPVHWDRSKSSDEADALMRHFLERGTLDSDGLRHSAKMAWRALALLEKELEGVELGRRAAETQKLWWENLLNSTFSYQPLESGANLGQLPDLCTIDEG